MSQATPEGVQKLRKGTRSCRECRRRKIRCIYTSELSQICKECLDHGRRCVSQAEPQKPGEKPVVDNRPKLRVRVAKLESMIERLAKAHPDRVASILAEDELHGRESEAPGRHVGALPGPSPHEWKQLEIETRLRSPLYALFDNEVLAPNMTGRFTIVDTTSSISFGSADLTDREKMLSVTVQEPDVLRVLDVAGSWWIAWQDQYPGMKDLSYAQSLRDYVEYHLAHERPIMVAIGIICIAMALLHLRPGIDDQNIHLSSPPKILMDNCLAAVDQIALANEDYVLNFEGLLALLIRAKTFAENNQLRKAWSTMRRAIDVAIRIDLPCSGQGLTETITRQRFVGSMFEMNRFMSLLLGLPYATDVNFHDKLASQALQSGTDTTTLMRALRRVTAVCAGRVNDRNASPPGPSLETTLDIQQDLERAASSMPPYWWDLASQSDDLVDPQLTHEHLMAQLWYTQTQCFLHLPFMLKHQVPVRQAESVQSDDFQPEQQYQQSYDACMQATRKLLEIFIKLRHVPILSLYTCRCEDFQGLFGAVILLVGLMQRNSDAETASFHNDLQLIETTKQVFAFSAQQQGGSIAKQGLQILNALGAFIEDRSNLPDGGHGPKSATLFMPYFGTIYVQAKAPNVSQRLSPSEGEIDFTPQVGPVNAAASSDCPWVPAADVTSGGLDSTIYCSPNSLGENTAVDWNEIFPDSSQAVSYNSADWDRLLFGSELDQTWNVRTQGPSTTV